jgi:hypothetical protein
VRGKKGDWKIKRMRSNRKTKKPWKVAAYSDNTYYITIQLLNMGFIMRNESFECLVCKVAVSPHPTGSARNHCPSCLASLHVDDEFPGDRGSACGGVMPAIDIVERKHKGQVILHKCKKCGKEMTNIFAPDDTIADFMMRLPELRMQREKGRRIVE